MTTRLMLLPAPPDAVTCKGCPHIPCQLAPPTYCFGGAKRPEKCLAAEQAAAAQSSDLERLRRVEAAARAVLDHWWASNPVVIVMQRLRAALEEK